jgi:ribosomal protein L33
MAKKKNTKRTLIGLVSTLTGHRIYTTVNKQNMQLKQQSGGSVKFRKRAYDPIARTHTWFEETKKNLGRNEIKPRKS